MRRNDSIALPTSSPPSPPLIPWTDLISRFRIWRNDSGSKFVCMLLRCHRASTNKNSTLRKFIRNWQKKKSPSPVIFRFCYSIIFNLRPISNLVDREIIIISLGNEGKSHLHTWIAPRHANSSRASLRVGLIIPADIFFLAIRRTKTKLREGAVVALVRWRSDRSTARFWSQLKLDRFEFRTLSIVVLPIFVIWKKFFEEIRKD